MIVFFMMKDFKLINDRFLIY